MSAEASTLATGQTVDGKYDIVRLLGQGGMGAVYEALHRGTHRRVALKVIVSSALAKEDGVLARFQREARASGSIDSAHVVQVLDTGVEPATGNPYMVMEYLSGEDVHDLIRRLGPLDPSLALRIVAQACLGLQRAHEAGVVHRDIKSANMYLARRDGGERTLKLLDFGIAKVRADGLAASEDQHLTRTGSLLGSPLFMSPEQARGMKNIDGRSDLWSLGIVLYQALTGRVPNDDKVTLGDLIIAVCTEDAPSVQVNAPWVSPQLAAIVGRALARDPGARFASAAAMHDALVALAPDGIGLREDMLVGLPDATRAQVAVSQTGPRSLALSAPTVLTPSPNSYPQSGSSPLASTDGAPPAAMPSQPSSVAGGQAITGASHDSMGSAGSSTVARQTSKRALGVMLAMAVVVVVGGGGTVFALKGRGVSKASVLIAASSSAPASPALPEPATPASSARPSPVHVVKVSVLAPPDAIAELDGTPAPVRGGAVEISGAPGSLHKLRLSLGDSSNVTDVTILESGAALPSTVTLVPKAQAKPVVGAKDQHTATAASVVVPKPKPVAAPPPAVPTPATEPTIKHTF